MSKDYILNAIHQGLWPVNDTFTDDEDTLLEDHLSDSRSEWVLVVGPTDIVKINSNKVGRNETPYGYPIEHHLQVPPGRAKRIEVTIKNDSPYAVDVGIVLRALGSNNIRASVYKEPNLYSTNYTEARIYENGTIRATGTATGGAQFSLGTYQHIATDDLVNTITCDATDADTSPELGIATWSAAGSGNADDRHIGVTSYNRNPAIGITWDNLTATL